MTLPGTTGKTITVLAVFAVLLFLLNKVFKTVNKETFYTYTEKKERQALPEKRLLDAVSANNMLTYLNLPLESEADGEGGRGGQRAQGTLGNDPDYLSSMCIQRKSANNKRACNSLYYILPKPQSTVNPGSFGDF
jgi:hypothetical protein